MKEIIIGLVVLSLVLVGCVRYVDVEKNVTIEKIIYQNVTTIVKEECNTTFNDQWDISKSRELELIRRLRFLENNQNLFWNDSECHDELNNTIVDLDYCEEEMCEWNSSWC